MTGAGPARSDDEERRDTVLQGTWIVGCGDIGRRMLARYRAAGVQCVAVTRSAASAEAATALGARVFTLDLDHPERWPDTGPDGAAVVYLAPPPREGTRDPRIRAFLDRHGANIRRLVLVSTTGVYGDCGGAWIDEDTPPAPATDRGRRRLDAENAARAWAARTGGGLVILRVPGIYSGDRLPVDRLRKALPVVRESESAFTNRIHAEDLARICMAAVESREPLLVLNATDGHPTTMTAYFNRVADALGLPRPPEVGLDEAQEALSPGMLSYAVESRRIGNRRLLDTLGIELEYPDLDATLSGLGRMRDSS